MLQTLDFGLMPPWTGREVIVLCSVGPGDAESVSSPAFKNLPSLSNEVLVSTTWFTSGGCKGNKSIRTVTN